MLHLILVFDPCGVYWEPKFVFLANEFTWDKFLQFPLTFFASSCASLSYRTLDQAGLFSDHNRIQLNSDFHYHFSKLLWLIWAIWSNSETILGIHLVADFLSIVIEVQNDPCLYLGRQCCCWSHWWIVMGFSIVKFSSFFRRSQSSS